MNESFALPVERLNRIDTGFGSGSIRVTNAIQIAEMDVSEPMLRFQTIECVFEDGRVIGALQTVVDRPRALEPWQVFLIKRMEDRAIADSRVPWCCLFREIELM